MPLRSLLVLLALFAWLPRTADAQKPPKPETALDRELAEAIRTAPTSARWPNADYIRILDTGSVTVRQDGTVVAEFREAYRLINERARRRAEVEIPFNESYEEVQVLRARTIRNDGAILNVRKEDIRLGSPFSDFALYDDSKSIGFSMPGVEDGCIIDYTYRKVTRPVLMPGHFWEYWRFSGVEPVGLCRYALTLPAGKAFRWKVHNNESLKPAETVSADGKTRKLVWEMRGIAPIPQEPMMPRLSEIGVWLEVTSIPSWQEIARWFWGLAKPQVALTPALRRAVDQIAAGRQTAEQKARAIYDFVANRVRYVGIEFGISAYRPHPAAQVHEKLYGDCKDKAHLLIAMLSHVGIKASPVLLRAGEQAETRSRLPSLSAFDHCIALAEVEGQKVWLDATAESTAYGDIPTAVRGADALVVREGAGTFERVPMFQPSENGFTVRTEAVLRPDGSAEVETRTQFRGGAAQYWRGYVRSLRPEQREDLIRSWAQTYSSGSRLLEYTLPDGTAKEGPFEIRIRVAAPNLARRAGSLFVLPVTIGRDTAEGNPFVQETRRWPIVMEEPATYHSETLVTLPEGFELVEPPADITLEGPLNHYQRRSTVSADGRTLTLVWTSETRAGRVPAEDYARVQAFYREIDRATEEALVIRRK